MLNSTYLLVAGFGYLLGSIPFGLLIAKMAGHGDIRKIGSGNIGATNVLRTGKKHLAILTLIFDAGKAGLAALLAAHFFGFVPSLIAGAAALIGHCFPVWLKFKGGKGVATYFGTFLAISLPVFLAAAILWLVSAFITRIVSLSGIITALVLPLIAFFIGKPEISVLAAIMGIIIIIRHSGNIGRILAGTEPRIGKKNAK